MKRIYLAMMCLVTVLTVRTGFAAAYYVDFAAGSDTNAGTSTGAAFKRCPGDAQAAGTAAATTLVAGDIVYFKGGVTYGPGTITLSWSGTSESARIIYDGNLSEGWGTGKAIINNSNSLTYTTGFNAAAARNWITIRYFEITEVGGLADPSGTCVSPVSNGNDGVGIKFANASTNIRIEKCKFHEIGEWHNAPPMEDGAINGAGVQFLGGSNLVVSDCEFTRMKVGASVLPSTTLDSLEIKGCNIHNYIQWGIDIAPTSNNATVSNIFIHGNRIHDYTEYDADVWTGCGSSPHTDGIFIRTVVTGVTWGRIDIYSNSFYSDAVTTLTGGTAAIYLSAGSSANIFNNTFVNTIHGRTIAILSAIPSGTSTQVVRIFNNTFFNNRTAVSLRDANPTRTIDISGNILYENRTASGYTVNVEDANSSPTNLDRNYYFTNNSSNYLIIVNGTPLTLAALQGAPYNWEANAGGGQDQDPLWVDSSPGLGVNASSNNLKLTATSPALAVSATSTLFGDDKSGRVRVGQWDRGAYQLAPWSPANLVARRSGGGM